MVANSDVAEMTATLASTIPPKFKVHEREETFLLLEKKLDKCKTLVRINKRWLFKGKHYMMR
jgi:hypothetical protein